MNGLVQPFLDGNNYNTQTFKVSNARKSRHIACSLRIQWAHLAAIDFVIFYIVELRYSKLLGIDRFLDFLHNSFYSIFN